MNQRPFWEGKNKEFDPQFSEQTVCKQVCAEIIGILSACLLLPSLMAVFQLITPLLISQGIYEGGWLHTLPFLDELAWLWLGMQFGFFVCYLVLRKIERPQTVTELKMTGGFGDPTSIIRMKE